MRSFVLKCLEQYTPLFIIQNTYITLYNNIKNKDIPCNEADCDDHEHAHCHAEYAPSNPANDILKVN